MKTSLKANLKKAPQLPRAIIVIGGDLEGKGNPPSWPEYDGPDPCEFTAPGGVYNPHSGLFDNGEGATNYRWTGETWEPLTA